MTISDFFLSLLWFMEGLVLLYLVYVVVYTLTFSLAGKVIRPQRFKEHQQLAKIAVLVPAYKEDAVIIETARYLNKQNYPADKFTAFIIADSLQPSTLRQLRKMPVEVIEVCFDKSTKVKALNKALSLIPEDEYQLALILDADNIMAPDFLQQMNGGYQQGHLAIQGRRIAKNNDSRLAVLDGVSEAINNHIYRQGSTALHMASSLIGSGMAFDFCLLKNTLVQMESIGGFDRELEVRLLQQGVKSVYTPFAKVKDEKVSQQEVFVKQRRRWISSQFIYLKRFLLPGTKSLFKGEFACFNSAVLRNIQLPRLLNLGLLALITLFFSFLPELSFMQHAIAYWILSGAMALAILLAIPKEYYSKPTLLALAELPKTFFNMFLLLFKLKGANKQFIHTQKGMAKTSSK